MSPVIKSYIRSAVIAVMPLLAAADTQWHHYLYAVLIALFGPLARAADPNDKAFGIGADK